ncbi:MAG: MBOAT family protein [Gemmatimonadaceae bacterium]
MIFNSNIFLFAFLPIVFTLFWIARGKQQRYVLLAVAGYVFYGYWDWRFCILLAFSSTVSFISGLMIDGTDSARGKRAWVIGAVSVDLTLLGFFKYYNFIAANLGIALDWMNVRAQPPVLHIILPIGISFYTFHTISYVVDVSKGKIKATRNIAEYFTYVSLFSQLIAGPIVRYRQIEADLETIDGPPRSDWIAIGIGFFVVGLIKKVIIADHIGAGIDPILAGYANGSISALTFAQAWTAAIGYTCQLYFDFSGYSDMAVGLGYLFSLRIPQNFDAPYRSLGIQDFWRRWHISLSTWLRDYLYFSLGGNRKGKRRMYVNLMIVMLLGGLWHGAGWTFLIWGGYHGILLIIDRLASPVFKRWPPMLYRAQTFFLVIIGWVFFRATSFKMATGWLRSMFTPGRSHTLSMPAAPMLFVWIAVALGAVMFLPETWNIRFGTTRRWAAIYAVGFVVAYLFMNGTNAPFLYYQF